MIRRHRRPTTDSDLDITAFMNLMIVLVPILLINMIFAHTSIIELNFPQGDNADAPDPEAFDLRVGIFPNRLDVLDGEVTVIKSIPNLDADIDAKTLSLTMQEIKKRVPEERNITLLAMPDTSYQRLISVMDVVRSYTAVVAGDAVEAELFPDIGIADAEIGSGENGAQ